MAAYVTLDGYTVRLTRETAIAITKTDFPLDTYVWLPRAACRDGDDLEKGDTDIVVRADMADSKGLYY